MKKLFLLFSLSFSLGIFAQRWAMHPLLFGGYEYNNHHFLNIGGRLLFLRNDDALFRVAPSALIGMNDGRVRVLPQIQTDLLLNFQKNRSLAHGHYWLIGVSANTHQITPKVGVNVLGVLEATIGYNFGYQDFLEKNMNGIHAGLILNVPVVIFKN